MGPNPIFARHPYYPTKCELCGWVGSSEQCRVYSNGDDADVGCPACDQIFLCDEIETEELNAAVVAQARAEGERAGIERAAQWHEDQYMRLREENYELVRKFGLPDHVRLDESYRHRRYAAAIRALKVEGE